MTPTSFNPNHVTPKRPPRRPATGIADPYRIHQDDTPTNNRRAGVLTALLMSLSALLLGTKAVVRLATILWRHFTASPRAALFELLYERQLLRGRYPRPLITPYLRQIAEHALPVRVYHIDDRQIVRRCAGTLLVTGDRYTVTGTDDILPCRFTAAEVINLFPVPSWLGEQVCITLDG